MADDNVIEVDFISREQKAGNRDDDEIIRSTDQQITEWQANGTPSLTAVQEMFYEAICAGASRMVRDRIIEAILAAFDKEVGGKSALKSTWNKLEKDRATECAQEARESTTQAELTPEQKTAVRDALWPIVRELAEAPDLIQRIVQQVQDLGVVNEADLITLIYIAATSRVLEKPVCVIVKGASGGGKSFTVLRVLMLHSSDYVNQLTSASSLSLVYDTRPLAHTVLFLFEATPLQSETQGEQDSKFAMFVRTLISEGRIEYEVSVEDPGSQTGRRVERITRKGPICFIVTTTGSVYDENETRMLSWYIHEDHEQTAAVMDGLADLASGTVATTADLAMWHDLQRWIALGPNDAVIPFARQISRKIPPRMVRFRRDLGSLFSFVKASALLHQAQRQRDAHGRVVATIADYALAYPIFSKVMAESSGEETPTNVQAVVKLIAELSKKEPAKPSTGMHFQRVNPTGHAQEIVISSEQIGLAIGISKKTAQRTVHKAIDLGILVNNETRDKKPYRLTLKHGVDKPAVSLLPDPATIVDPALIADISPETAVIATNGGVASSLSSQDQLPHPSPPQNGGAA